MADTATALLIEYISNSPFKLNAFLLPNIRTIGSTIYWHEL